MNATLKKFGFPETLIRDYTHWCVVLRHSQATLGALVLIAKSDVTQLGDLPPEAFAELQRCTNHIETALRHMCAYDKINYLALMMVDPHVHFHVLPRYSQDQVFDGITFRDPGWPGVPDLKASTELPEFSRQKLQNALLDAFRKLV
jgi:diadenosine tetraphosphate (Ap4A) HIT family hydrolase